MIDQRPDPDFGVQYVDLGPLDVVDWEPEEAFLEGYQRGREDGGALSGLVTVGVVGGLVGLVLGFMLAVQVNAASPGSADPTAVMRPIPEAPRSLPVEDRRPTHQPQPAIGNGAAPVAVPPDPTSPPEAQLISGTATWYCSSRSACTRGYGPSDLVAAIDPGLGIRRGERLRVTSISGHVDVTVVDVCACAGRRVIDLTSGAFRRLAPLSSGVVFVTLERLTGAEPTTPATDTR